MTGLLPVLTLLAGAGLQAVALALSVSVRGMTALGLLLWLAGVGLGMVALVPKSGSLPGARRSAAALVAAFGLFLPVLGLGGLGLILALRARRGPRRRDSAVREIPSPPLPASPLHTDANARFGPGSLEGILRHSPDAETRLRVVLACRQLKSRLTVPLLRLALRDPVDDVRLLAYAVLDGRERQIQTQIQAIRDRAGRRGDETLPLASQQRLAELHWELAYQGLVEGELLTFTLEKVLFHTANVLRATGGAPRMAFLAGRVKLLQRASEGARVMFHESLRRGLPVEVVGPYLAEAEYQEGKAFLVRKHVARFSESARLRPGLGVIVERWT